MELTFVTEFGDVFTVEIDPNMELENVMALLEVESGIPASDQSISLDGRQLTEPKRTMLELGATGASVMLQLRRKVRVTNPAGQAIPQDAETIRLQILGDPSLMAQLRERRPDLAEAAVNDPARFADLLRQTHEAERAQEREIAMLNADPFNLEAQRRIEEIIREQAMLENMRHAMEYSPESFAVVTMLYVPVEVNGHPIKAFVDSGAQKTIMTPECAEACGIMRLVDRRYAGIAMGVGTAKILGRVHSVQLKVADLHLPCSVTIMEGRDVDLLFGLDMLKAHQACIDLSKNVLRIQGREVEFLPEHQLPEKARREARGEPPESSTSGSSILEAPSQASSFPGTGTTLGGPPSSRPSNPQPSQSRHSEESIQLLMGLGADRELAIRSLDAANGNVDVAASLLF